MPRRRIDIDDHRTLLSDLSGNHVPIAEMRQILRDRFDLKIGERALKSRLKEWQITRYVRADTSDEFHDRVTQLFRSGLPYAEILRVLHQEGFSATDVSLTVLDN